VKASTVLFNILNYMYGAPFSFSLKHFQVEDLKVLVLH